MNTEEQHSKPSLGEIEVFLRQGGVDKVILTQKNLIVNTGMDLLAKAVAGQQFISGMYLLYSNAGSPIGEPSPSVTTTAQYYQSTGSDATKGFQRVPMAALPSFASSDIGTYNNNKAIFMAITDGNVAVPIAGNEITPGVSIVYGAGLVFMDQDDMANDVLYSAVNFADIVGVLDELTILAGAQIGVRWSQSFVQP
jgi:hypothetical protein